MREAIDDLCNIAHLGYDEDKDREAFAQSLEEVIEYVRMAAILCNNDFTRPDDDWAPTPFGLIYININAGLASAYWPRQMSRAC